ncbi:hypothetical protein [Pedobacter sp. ASV28]|uniref:hypothetical protein n=1 Tax=Pedobacter sp. ASV28 TaxID=2795123 RepID=UPI0018EAEBCE|nr:hypothetical protein [Pedobacter sp. ASV28]
MNALEQYIGDLNPSCWLNSDHVNGYGVTQPSINADVNTWVDISGNGNNFVHEVIPTYNPPKFNNTTMFNATYPSLEFVVANKNTLTTVSETPTVWTDTATIVIVCSNHLINNTEIFSFANTGVVNGSLSFSGFINRTTIGTYNLNIPYEFSLFISTVRTPYLAIIKISGESSLGLSNGRFTSQLINSSYSYGTNNLTNPLQTPGYTRRIALGGRRLNSSLYDRLSSTNIHEVIIFPRILPDAETSQVQTYLKLKYNI